MTSPRRPRPESVATDPSPRPTRRAFGKAVAGAAVGAFAAPGFLRARNLNDILNIAVIGTGGRGGSNLQSVGSQNITVLCDVNQNAVDAAAQRFPKAKKYKDLRRVFDSPGDFDAVIVSTPEHTHTIPTYLALTHGKHVYCEKPLTTTSGKPG